MVTQFTSTVNVNNFVLVERAIRFEADLAIQKILFFTHLLWVLVFVLSIHDVSAASLLDFSNNGTCRGS